MDSLNYTDFGDQTSLLLTGGVNGTNGVSEAVGGIIIPPSDSDMRSAILVAYLLTFIFGSLGNGLVIYVIWRHPEIRVKSVANYYILNLAVADFFFVMTLVFFWYTTFTSHWVFGGVVCKLAYAIRESSKYVSIFTLVALSFDRYLASFYNAGRFRTMTVGKVVCCAIWGCFVIMTTPYWLYCQVVPRGGNRASCRVVLPQAASPVTVLKAWGWTQFTLGFLFPFLLIVTAYMVLGVRLHRLLGAGTRTGVKRPGRAMTRMTLVITVTFLVTQLPYHIVWFLNVAKMEVVHASLGRSMVALSTNRTSVEVAGSRAIVHQNEIKLYVILQAVATILVFVCSCCNPVIYGLLNHNYRKLYADVFCSRCRRHEAIEAGAGSSDSGAANGDSRNRARQTGVTCVTGVANTDVIELSRMIE